MSGGANGTVHGCLAKDPRTREHGGTTFCDLTIPVDKGRDTPTTWWTINLAGKQAESAARHLRKGSSVVCSGAISVREYQGSSGSGFSPEMSFSSWSFASRGNDEQQGSNTGGQGGNPAPDDFGPPPPGFDGGGQQQGGGGAGRGTGGPSDDDIHFVCDTGVSDGA